MIPIFLSASDGRQGYQFKNFSENFARICRSHREDGRALAFAFILYDFTHAHTAKVLNDDEYWQALDRISGQSLTVFSFHVKNQPPRIRRGEKSMAPVFHTPDDHDRVSRFIRKIFGEDAMRTLPILLFFQVDDDLAVIDSFIVRFNDGGKESVFGKIRSALTAAVESISKVEPQFRGNTAEIFALIKQRLRERQGLEFIRAAVNIYKEIKSLFG